MLVLKRSPVVLPVVVWKGNLGAAECSSIRLNQHRYYLCKAGKLATHSWTIFKLCATTDILHTRELKTRGSGPSVNSVSGDWHHAWRGCLRCGRTYSLPQACLHCHLLCWCLSSFLGPAKFV